MSVDIQTKKQHFVPQFYLRFFADSQKLLQVYDIKNNRLGSPRSSSGTGYKKYFYAAETGVPDEASQQIEKWLQVYENTISQELPKIIDKILSHQHIDDDDKYILSALMCMLWLRSPGMRAQLNRMNEDITKQMMSFYVPERVDSLIKKDGVKMSNEEHLDMIKTLEDGSYKLKFNNAQHLQFMTRSFGFGGPGFINMFFGHKWKIYIAKGKKRFITTDSPVVEWHPPPQTFYGASFLERNKYFALTPEIFIELTYPVGSEKVKRVTIFEDRDNDVMVFNILLASYGGHKHAYSNDRALIESLISGRNNPGLIEKTYYERYRKPWDMARKAGRV